VRQHVGRAPSGVGQTDRDVDPDDGEVTVHLVIGNQHGDRLRDMYRGGTIVQEPRLPSPLGGVHTQPP
jgi:hypothetical protein